MVRDLIATLIFCSSLALAAPDYAWAAQTLPCPRAPERSVAAGGVIEITDRNLPCRIEFRETGVRLESAADGSRPDPGPTVVVDSNGRFFSANAIGWGATISLWDSRGGYLSSFGGEGDGPGELRQRGAMDLLIDGRDNVHIRDGAFRWSVFSPEQQFLRRVSARAMGGLAWTTVILDDGSALSSDGLVSPEYRFQVADSTGALARSFGPVGDGAAGRGPRPISHGGGDTFWAGPGHEGADAYILEEWGLDGTLRRTMRRNASWFRWDGPSELAPRVTQLHVARGGLLYVVVWRPTDEYEKEYERAQRGRRGGIDLQGLEEEERRMEEMTELVLEVIDTRSGRLLASDAHRTSDMRDTLPLGMFRGSLQGYRYGESEGGLPYVEIVTLELRAR